MGRLIDDSSDSEIKKNKKPGEEDEKTEFVETELTKFKQEYERLNTCRLDIAASKSTSLVNCRNVYLETREQLKNSIFFDIDRIIFSERYEN